LIDPQSNATLAAGMIRRGVAKSQSAAAHKSALVQFAADSSAEIAQVEGLLLAEGAAVVRTRVVGDKTLRGLLSLGLIVLLEGSVDLAVKDAIVLKSGTFANADELIAHLREAGALAPQDGSIA